MSASSSSSPASDNASGTTENVHDFRGYPALATVMGPHRGMALFKRFAALNARNLLYMQAELLELEQQLDTAASLDREDGLPYDVNAIELMCFNGEEAETEQRQIVFKIRRKLKEYSKQDDALLQQSEVGKLQKANKYDLRLLREWLARPRCGDGFLTGVEARPWSRDDDDGDASDLVALSARRHDAFTRCLSEKLVPWLFERGFSRAKKPLPGHEEAGLVEWSDAAYGRAARTLAVLASTLIPSVAVIALYFIHNLLARIFAALGFSALFSLALALLTAARPAEIFGATAAFASVQVVFIGSTGTS